jgi:hypothetical protein
MACSEVRIVLRFTGSFPPPIKIPLHFSMDASESDHKELAPVQIHPAFSHLQINPSTFDPEWNWDFRLEEMCPAGEKRGGFPYIAAKGWNRFGMNVTQKFQDGDVWLGMTNGPGEWALVYHGTKSRFVDSITKNSLHPGAGNSYGYGIYCSPDPTAAESYTDVLDLQTNTGTRKYKCMLVCRVNVSSVHYCTTSPCPHDRDPTYTVHITTFPKYWFVNCQNQGYQHIRPYGILVKEVP